MTRKPCVIIVHGWEGKPDSNWFPWLARELTTRGVHVESPQFPADHVPKLADWLAALDVHDGDVLVGHSLGVITILRSLASRQTTVAGTVLVSGFARTVGIEQLNDFFTEPIDFDAVRAHCPAFTVINGDNDPYVPLAEGEYLAIHLRTPLIVAHGKGHLNESSGVTQYRPILDAVLSVLE